MSELEPEGRGFQGAGLRERPEDRCTYRGKVTFDLLQLTATEKETSSMLQFAAKGLVFFILWEEW